jgi:hypothetical protein
MTIGDIAASRACSVWPHALEPLFLRFIEAILIPFPGDVFPVGIHPVDDKEKKQDHYGKSDNKGKQNGPPRRNVHEIYDAQSPHAASFHRLPLRSRRRGV